MNAKAIIGVVVVAILIGVLYVVFEKNFSQPAPLNQTSGVSNQEKITSPSGPETMPLPTPEPALPAIDSNSNLQEEASTLQMRDYSQMFEDLKDKVSQ